jgi:hypothetical protein
MSDVYPFQRNDFRITHLDRALGNDNFCNKVDPFLIIRVIRAFLKIIEPIFTGQTF